VLSMIEILLLDVGLINYIRDNIDTPHTIRNCHQRADNAK